MFGLKAFMPVLRWCLTPQRRLLLTWPHRQVASCPPGCRSTTVKSDTRA